MTPSAGPKDAAPADILAKISRANATTLEKTRLRHSYDRSIIGISVVLAFLLAIGALFVYVLVAEPWKDKAEFLATTLGSVLLPVVTLVLGYYFGTEKAAQSD